MVREIFVASDLARRRTEVIGRARTEGVALIRDADGAPLALVTGAMLATNALQQRCLTLLCDVVSGHDALTADWAVERRQRFAVDLVAAIERALVLANFEPVEALLAASRPPHSTERPTRSDDPADSGAVATDVDEVRRAAAVVSRRPE